MLAELDDSKFALTRDPFVAAAVEQRDEVHAVGGGLGIGRGVSERQLDAPVGLASDEDIVQDPFRIDPLRVKNRIAAAEGAEASRVELAELRLFDRRLPEQLHLLVSARHLDEGQPRESHRDHRRKHEQRRQQSRGRETARLQSGHLAVVIEAPEREHHGEQQPDRHDHGQIHHRAQGDQFEDHVPPVLIVGGLTENPGQLVRNENGHQNPGHRKPCLHHFAQHISLNGPFHGRRA